MNNDDDNRVVSQYFHEGTVAVMERLAEEFELSVRRVKMIVYKGQERVFAHL